MSREREREGRKSSRRWNLVPTFVPRTTNHPWLRSLALFLSLFAVEAGERERTLYKPAGGFRERNLTYQLASRSKGPYPPRAFDRAPRDASLLRTLSCFFSIFLFFNFSLFLSRRCENRGTHGHFVKLCLYVHVYSKVAFTTSSLARLWWERKRETKKKISWRVYALLEWNSCKSYQHLFSSSLLCFVRPCVFLSSPSHPVYDAPGQVKQSLSFFSFSPSRSLSLSVPLSRVLKFSFLHRVFLTSSSIPRHASSKLLVPRETRVVEKRNENTSKMNL